MALSELERRVCERLGGQGDDLLAELDAHVAIPTGRRHAPGLAAYRELVGGRLAELGAAPEFLEGRPRPAWLDGPDAEPASDGESRTVLAARRCGDGQRPRVLIVGHLDTVHDPRGDFRRLTVAPDGGLATGPGAVDMKGGIVVALAALRALAETGAGPAWTMLLNADEETGSFHSAAVLRAEAARHDLGIVLEPALPGGALAISRFGSGQFKVEAFGRSAHAGREFTRGVSAVVKLAEVIGALHALAEPEAGLIVNVGPLQGGLVTNTVPDYAACWGNVRYPDPEGGRRLAEAIDALAAAGMPRVEVHRDWNRPAKPATDAVRHFADLARAAARDLGGELPFAATGGVCDGNILQDAGLPTLDTLGVRGGNLHRLDEYVEVPSLLDRSRLLAVLLLRLGAAVRVG